MKLVIGVEEALRLPNGNRFTNAMAFALAFPPPKTLNWRVTFTLHLNRSWPLFDSEFGGGFKPVKTITISIIFERVNRSQGYLSLRCIWIISQISEPLSVVI
jgi:hypothetical protein